MKIDINKWFQIDSTRKVFVFVFVIMGLSAAFVNGVSFLLLSEQDFWANRIVANIEVGVLSLTIGYFVASQIRKIVSLKAALEFALKHDPLTGASTRCHMNSFLSEDDVFPCPIIMTDIDHFKKINDTHGHLIGDVVLFQFVALLEKCVRETDIVVRLGGEEFLIILPLTKFTEAQDIAERMRETIAGHQFVGSKNSISVTASFGVGTLKKREEVDQGMNVVDQALYRAKSEGRNRVCFEIP